MPQEPNRYLEHLYHFHCHHCQKWWSIADAPKEKQEWFCPWCGQKNQIIEAYES